MLPRKRVLRRVSRFLPRSLRARIRRLLTALGNVPMIHHPTYADDGLISQHVTDFMNDNQFIESYNLGVATGAIENHPGDIHFRAYIACWAAKQAVALPGDFVECGVGKGLLSKTIVNFLGFDQIPKTFYLFDTFEGIPSAEDNSEKENVSFLNELHFSVPYFEQVANTFKDYENVLLVKGIVPGAFDEVEIGPISYLSVDMNNARAEVSAIKYLWDKLVFGGIILLDDYAYGTEFIAQKTALDALGEELSFNILTLPTGQGLIIKNRE